jgi:spermidine/putrescine transport system ATP-binding protein
MTLIATGISGVPAVELRSVSRSFGSTTAVRDLSLVLRRGEFFSLLGPSGCGKTTTLRMIAGFERPNTGSIFIKGRDVRNAPPNRRPVNTVFQSYALFSHLNVGENVEFGLREKRVPRTERVSAVRDTLALVRLSGYENRRAHELSGGEQQRVALARAIINRPDVLLLDEPLGALDLKLRRAMQEELKALQKRLEMTFLYVTHDQEEALLMSDRVGVMAAGQLEQVGSPEELYDRPASPFVADFVGEANILAAQVIEASKGEGVRVRLANDQLMRAACTTSSVSGSTGVLVVRPERIRLELDDRPESESSPTGNIESVFFVGTFRRFVVNLGAGMRVAVVSTNLGPVELTPGSKVRLVIGADQAWFLPGVIPPEGARSTQLQDCANVPQVAEANHGNESAEKMARRIQAGLGKAGR